MNTVLQNQVIVRRPSRQLHFLAKRLKGPLQRGIYAILIMGIGFLAWWGMTQSRYFALKKMEVVGTLRTLSMAEITEAVGIPLGTNLFRLPLTVVEENILKLRWIQSVSIRRQMPNTLWIHVKEHQPKALLLTDKLYFVSREGASFKEVEMEARRDLPVLTGTHNEASIQRAIQLIEFFEKKHDFAVFGLAEIHYNGANGFSVVTPTGPMEIKLGKENLAEQLARLTTVWSYLQPRIGLIRGIDLAYDDRAFVKL